jgi:hypothetical protein
MKRIVLRACAAVLVLAGLNYALDYAIFRFRIWRNLSPYGSVTVVSYYAIPEKNQKTEYVYGSSQQETCANCWFPHSGYRPCWYARRHTERVTD